MLGSNMHLVHYDRRMASELWGQAPHGQRECDGHCRHAMRRVALHRLAMPRGGLVAEACSAVSAGEWRNVCAVAALS